MDATSTIVAVSALYLVTGLRVAQHYQLNDQCETIDHFRRAIVAGKLFTSSWKENCKAKKVQAATDERNGRGDVIGPSSPRRRRESKA